MIELLVVIAVIAVLIAVLIPSLQAARSQAWSVSCMSNEKTLLTGWLMYANDWHGYLVHPLVGPYDDNDVTPWVYMPKDENGEFLAYPVPSTITNEDRFRGIRAGALWKYIKDLDVYHCPGDKRNSTQIPPDDFWRSYSMTPAFGHTLTHATGHYRKLHEVENAALYYVFIEEEQNNIFNYGENYAAWIPGFETSPLNLSEWAFHYPLASFHTKSGMFGFADGHAGKRTWTDPRTLKFIEYTKNMLSLEPIESPGNEDMRWLMEHFWSKERAIIHSKARWTGSQGGR